MKIAEQFIWCIHDAIRRWDRETISSKEKMEGLAHEILVCLDGASGSFSGNIDDLAKDCKNLMLHDLFYEVKKCE